MKIKYILTTICFLNYVAITPEEIEKWPAEKLAALSPIELEKILSHKSFNTLNPEITTNYENILNSAKQLITRFKEHDNKVLEHPKKISEHDKKVIENQEKMKKTKPKYLEKRKELDEEKQKLDEERKELDEEKQKLDEEVQKSQSDIFKLAKELIQFGKKEKILEFETRPKKTLHLTGKDIEASYHRMVLRLQSKQGEIHILSCYINECENIYYQLTYNRLTNLILKTINLQLTEIGVKDEKSEKEELREKNEKLETEVKELKAKIQELENDLKKAK